MAYKYEIQHQIMMKTSSTCIALSQTRLTDEIEHNEMNQNIV